MGKGPGEGEVKIEDGYVQVPLRGRIDVAGLSQDLRKKGYFLANDPWDIDSQGWGGIGTWRAITPTGFFGMVRSGSLPFPP